MSLIDDTMLDGEPGQRMVGLLGHRFRCPGRYKLVTNEKRLIWEFRCSCRVAAAGLRKTEVAARDVSPFNQVLARERRLEPVVELLNVGRWDIMSLDAMRSGALAVFVERRGRR